MKRVPEPEVMDDQAQALAYARADFAESNQRFVDRLRERFPELSSGTIVDLGCGPADIPIRIARALPRVRVIGVDASQPMLALGREAVAAAGLAGRIELRQGRIPGLEGIPARSAAAVVSNSLLHHLPDPGVLWSEVQRLGGPGAPVLVMDLFRPESVEAAKRIVAEAGCCKAGSAADAASRADPLLVRDFEASLLAAFTLDEVRAQLSSAGLALESALVSERHLLVWGRL